MWTHFPHQWHIMELNVRLWRFSSILISDKWGHTFSSLEKSPLHMHEQSEIMIFKRITADVNLNQISISQVRTASPNSNLNCTTVAIIYLCPYKISTSNNSYVWTYKAWCTWRERIRVTKEMMNLLFHNPVHFFPKHNFTCIHLYFPKLT